MTPTDALFNAVYADPRADGPRAVLADHLLEGNDPRGEFIALQLQKQRRPLSASGTRREKQLLHAHRAAWLGPLMRLLVGEEKWDRGFLSHALVSQVAQRGAHLLARIKKNLVFEPIRRLSDGSYLAKLYGSPRQRERDEGGIQVRIIEYTLDDPGRPGRGEKHRLLTTLLSASRHPAKRLVVLYHERWEIETTLKEMKTHLRGARVVLRSKTPDLVRQEFYGLWLAHFAVRRLMHEAALQKDIDPDELSFKKSLHIIRCKLPHAGAVPP